MRLIAVATSFQGLLSMLEKDKVEKGQDMYTPDLYDDNYAKCKTPFSISAADMLLQPTMAQILISLCKNPCARQFLFQNTVIVEKLNSGKSKKLLSRLVPSRTHLVIDRWNSELAHSNVIFV